MDVHRLLHLSGAQLAVQGLMKIKFLNLSSLGYENQVEQGRVLSKPNKHIEQFEPINIVRICIIVQSLIECFVM